jgi:hypothetical protein
MKIVKRNFANLAGSISIWLIPMLSYLFGKVGGVEYHREWIWWVGIPTLILGWLLLNFKIKKI